MHEDTYKTSTMNMLPPQKTNLHWRDYLQQVVSLIQILQLIIYKNLFYFILFSL